MAIQTKRRMSVAQYLEWEARQEVKHDFIDGTIIEMSGGNLTHTRIKTNIGGTLFALLDPAAYTLCNSDMRVRISQTRYVYPDFSVVSGMPRMEDDKQVTLLNPILVVEVTSPSSAVRDRADKPYYCLDVPSIETYLIIDQDRPRADLYTRAEDGWHLRVFSSPADSVPLATIGCELPLELVYRGIDFARAQN